MTKKFIFYEFLWIFERSFGILWDLNNFLEGFPQYRCNFQGFFGILKDSWWFSKIFWYFKTIFLVADHGSGHAMDGGNRQIREPQQTPSQGWSTSNQELGVSYKSMMEASPSDDHDDLTLFFPTVRTVATGGRISANSHHSVGLYGN